MKNERGYRVLLRWAALPVTDRRWAAPLAAVALGFGLFVGVAIGPGASGTLAGGVPQVIEVAGLGGGGGGGEEEASGFEEGEAEEPFEAEAEASESGFEFAEEETFEAPEAASEGSSPPATKPKPKPEAEDEPEEELITLSGVVVHSNPAAGSYAVAESSGALSAVHAAKLPSPGTKLSVPVRTLANGTFAEGGARKQTGAAPKAKLEGIVTYVDADPAAPAYAVSKRGVSALVRVRPDPTGAPPQLPVLGAFAKVGVEIEKLAATPAEAPPTLAPEVPVPVQPVCEGAPWPTPELLPQVPAAVATLWQTSLDASGVPFTYSDFAGVVTAVCAQEGRLVISADDVREAGADLSIVVPSKLATAELKPGDSVLATAEIGATGELTLKGLASDEHSKGADDADATQGDLVNHLDE
ncbi:MAG: hypothetical protein JJE35_15755 [Thermoleophilia bacterium]|nr:hypothetical protein [Thermoleophilia bacterium]